MVWDLAESSPLIDASGGFIQAVEWIARVMDHLENATKEAPIARTTATIGYRTSNPIDST